MIYETLFDQVVIDNWVNFIILKIPLLQHPVQLLCIFRINILADVADADSTDCKDKIEDIVEETPFRLRC